MYTIESLFPIKYKKLEDIYNMVVKMPDDPSTLLNQELKSIKEDFSGYAGSTHPVITEEFRLLFHNNRLITALEHSKPGSIRVVIELLKNYLQDIQPILDNAWHKYNEDRVKEGLAPLLTSKERHKNLEYWSLPWVKPYRTLSNRIRVLTYLLKFKLETQHIKKMLDDTSPQGFFLFKNHRKKHILFQYDDIFPTEPLSPTASMNVI